MITQKRKLLKVLHTNQITSTLSYSCTHWVLEPFKPTTTVLRALIIGIEIVTPDFILSTVKDKNVAKYRPSTNSQPPQECLTVNPKRSTMFKGFVFHFKIESEFKAYKHIIEQTGGKIHFNSTMACTIVLYYDDEKEQRVISKESINYAIFHVTTTKLFRGTMNVDATTEQLIEHETSIILKKIGGLETICSQKPISTEVPILLYKPYSES